MSEKSINSTCLSPSEASIIPDWTVNDMLWFKLLRILINTSMSSTLGHSKNLSSIYLRNIFVIKSQKEKPK